eukprot:1987410-Pleurochrysis_carterae.AAC.2
MEEPGRRQIVWHLRQQVFDPSVHLRPATLRAACAVAAAWSAVCCVADSEEARRRRRVCGTACELAGCAYRKASQGSRQECPFALCLKKKKAVSASI